MGNFDYSTVDPETASILQGHAEEIDKQMERAGDAFWKAGIALIGGNATIHQIANLLSAQWGYDKELITNCMNRAKKPWS